MPPCRCGVPGLWRQDLHRLKELGLPDQQIADHLAGIRIEVVLTAHPTEARRATVLEHHRRLYLLLVKRETHIRTPSERERIREALKVELERLWRTGEIYLAKPDVASERRNILHHRQEAFPLVVPELDRRLWYNWQALGFDPTLIETPFQMPRLAFGNWVGGDRNGHPLVTAAVTQETLYDLWQAAPGLRKQQLIEPAVRRSLSEHLQITPPALLDRIAEMAHSLSTRGHQAMRRNPEEPWRQIAFSVPGELD